MFFSDQEEAYGQAVEQSQQGQAQVQVPSDETFDLLEESIEGSLTEAEKRLEKAQFYKAVMKGGFFGQNQSILAKEVETEIRKFATERMNVLLGISQAPQVVQQSKMPFTDQEIDYLKKMLQKAMNRQAASPPVVTPVTVQPVVEQVQTVQPSSNSTAQQLPPQHQVKKPVGRPRKAPVQIPGAIPTPTKEEMERIMQHQGLQAQMAPQVVITTSHATEGKR